MRLSSAQASLIKQQARKIFGQDADVWLFGSRADDGLRGGDIDLLVESQGPVSGRVAKVCQLHADLQLALGEQKIDIVVLDPSMPVSPIHENAKRKGVRL